MDCATWNWKKVGLGAEIVLLIILSLELARYVAERFWIAAQICLLGILLLLGIAIWQIGRLIAESRSKPRGDSDGHRIATIVSLLQFTSFGILAIIIYAIQYDHWKSAAVARIAGVGLLTAGASLAAGAVLGFIFGVPRSPAAPAPSSGGPAAGAATGSTGSDGQFGANTNLEQISDWLTKTIVGVSLVELSKLPPLLDKLAVYVSAGMGDPTAHTKAVALVVMVYFASTGFLISYLWTRMELTRAFSESALSKRVRDLEMQSDIDAAATSNIDRWLHHHPAKQDEDKARREMMDAIKNSSSEAKARAFVTADNFKRDAGQTKAEIQAASELTLPIFQALVEADTEQIFHRNRAQYAFCLMTQPTPNWQAALQMLQEAIAIRDRSGEPGWPEYEFARAICRIDLDPQARSKPDTKRTIDTDLKKADDLKLPPEKRTRLDLDNVVAQWQQTP